MEFWLLEAACAVLVVFGIVLVLRRPVEPPRDKPALTPADDPGTYIRRIAGVMIAAFGLAFGIISAVYRFA